MQPNEPPRGNPEGTQYGSTQQSQLYSGTPPRQESPQSRQPPQQGGSQHLESVSEADEETPTLRWISIGHPQERTAIGEEDYVLDSFYNVEIDAWEVLVIVRPGDDDDEEDEEDE